MRYDTARDYGGKEAETRRAYNERFGQPPGPDLDIPAVADYVWEWFWSLNSRRGFVESGMLPLSYAEIDAWARRMRISITPEEVEMLTRMDDAMLAASAVEAEDAQERANRKGPRPKR